MKKLRRYEVSFSLNVIEFYCIVRAHNKKEAIADVMFNINLRTLDKIRGVVARGLPQEGRGE